MVKTLISIFVLLLTLSCANDSKQQRINELYTLIEDCENSKIEFQNQLRQGDNNEIDIEKSNFLGKQVTKGQIREANLRQINQSIRDYKRELETLQNN